MIQRHLFLLACALVGQLLLQAHAHAQHAEGGAGLEEPAPSGDAVPNAPTNYEGANGAAEGSGPRIFSVEVLLGTTVPIDVHVGANFVLFERVFLNASVGRGAYGGAIGSIAGAFGGDEVQSIVEDLYGSAWTTRFGVGVRPFGRGGPELVLGVGRLRADGVWNAGTFSLPAALGDVGIEARMTLFYAELGWTLRLGKRFLLRPSVGWTQTIGASTRATTTANLSSQVQAGVAAAESLVEDALRSYGRTPTLGLAFGVSF
ncbi:MAG: hypothetical protein AAF938_21855 [Myxococcota bacterium]